MQKILGGVAVCGVVAVIALGAREELVREPEPQAAASAGGSAQAAPTGPAAQRAGGASPSPAVDSPDDGLAAARAPAPGAAAGGVDAAASRLAADAGIPAASGAETADAGVPASTDAAGAASPAGEAPEAQADAQAILRAAEVAYGRVRSLRADFVQVMRNPLLGSTTTSRGTLFERRPDRFLMRFSQPAGDMLVSDGRYFWVYYPSVDAKQVIRMPAAAGRGGVDLQAQFLGDAGRRFTPHLEGTATVAGRRTQVLLLTPRTAAPYRQLKVWLDTRDHLARRVEITEENGSVRRVELRNLRVNAPVTDATFRFQPPAGAHVVDRS